MAISSIAVILLLAFSPQKSTVEKSPSIEQPQSVEEALEQLEKIFGKHDPQHQKLWWISNLRYTQDRPEDGPRILGIMQDLISYGSPSRIGNLIGLDRMNLRRAWSYKVGPDGDRKLIWSQQRQSATRYLFRRTSAGVWRVDLMSLSHSMPDVGGLPYSRGAAVWKQNGIEIVSTAMDSTQVEDGSFRDAPLLSQEWFMASISTSISRRRRTRARSQSRISNAHSQKSLNSLMRLHGGLGNLLTQAG